MIDAYDATDDIFAALASAPITNLSSTDASYEWYQYANEEYFLFNSMAFDREGNDISAIFPVGGNVFYPLGSNILGGAHEDELSALLYDWYVDYVQGLGLDLGGDGRSGEFYDGFAARPLTTYGRIFWSLYFWQRYAVWRSLSPATRMCSFRPSSATQRRILKLKIAKVSAN